MLRVLWEIVLPLLVAFGVGWVVMGWLTWRWRRASVSQVTWAGLNDELTQARAKLGRAEAKLAELESAGPARSNGSGDPEPEGNRNGSAVEDESDAATESAPIDDDLKAIRGVGHKMEAKLNELGITSLRQVATFTGDDIKRVSAGIGAFPGRIERDRWVPQAKALVDELGAEQPTA